MLQLEFLISLRKKQELTLNNDVDCSTKKGQTEDKLISWLETLGICL